MCVILDIKPNASMPDDLLAQACDINRHGYGVSYVADKTIHTLRSIKDNDPKEVKDCLEKLKKFRRFVHLRHATVGAVSMLNSHPITVLQRKRRDELMMMHNGTLYEYKPADTTSDKSDTLVYVEELIRPLALRVESYVGVKKVLTDPLFQKVATKGVGTSVLLFFDAYGNVLKVNASLGKEFDWGWASNSYSFSPTHVRSTTRSRTLPAYDWERGFTVDDTPEYHSADSLPWERSAPSSVSEGMADWEKHLASSPVTGTGGANSNLPVVVVRSGQIPMSAEAARRQARLLSQFGHVAKNYSAAKTRGRKMMSNASVAVLASPRTSFVDSAGMKSLDELSAFTPAELEEMCQKYPAAMAQCIIDLFVEWQKTGRQNQEQTKRILALTEQRGAA